MSDLHQGECLLTRLPHLKCIRLGYVPLSHPHLKRNRLVTSVQVFLVYVGSIATPCILNGAACE